MTPASVGPAFIVAVAFSGMAMLVPAHAAPSRGTEAAAPPAAPAASAPAPGYFHKRLAGRVGERLGFRMDLKNVDGTLSGSYRYDGHRADLSLQGSVRPGGAFTLEERDFSRITGRLTGTIVGGHLAGTWQSADGARTLPVVADQVSEILVGSQREILARLVGDYPLESISGSGGANGMWDTMRVRGRWQSSSSGISGGRRVAEQVGLSKADLELLDTARMTIGADFSVQLHARGKLLLTIAHRPDGMVYELARPHNEVAVEGLKKLSAQTAVHDERLYFLVRDGVDLTGPLGGSFEGQAADILVVSYGLIDQRLVLNFIDGGCCGGTSWTFGPKSHP